jgi:hypothetical protein
MPTPYSQFFLNSASNVVQFETIEISHPSFSKVYRLVRNAMNGLQAILEDLVTLATFDYQPTKISPPKAADDLDQILHIDLGDVLQPLAVELDNVNAAGTFSVKPTVIYRTYRSDDLSAPLYGPITFELANLAFNKKGCSFDAQAPKVNINSTGELYTVNRFPMLKGFL